jgi:3-hydroxypropanoate dehydrogenase
MQAKVNSHALDVMFRHARSYNRWSPTQVTDQQIHEIYELLKMGPTSANCSPARFVFVRGAGAKTRLLSCVSEGNKVKVDQAGVTVIIGMDEKFYDKLPFLFPHKPDAGKWFTEIATETAMRNSSLQGAYLILAARALGIDCGPMSGFDHTKVDAEFFAGTSIKSNFLCAMGEGTQEQLFPRSPRFAFDDVCRIE